MTTQAPETTDEVFVFPASFAQQRLWFLEQLEPGSAAYHIAQATRIRGPLDHGALRRAVAAVVARHESLRTTFASRQGRPVQLVALEAEVDVPLVDLGALPSGERHAAFRRELEAAARRPFDLARGPLLRLALLRQTPVDHVLLVTVHHLVADAWSMGVLVREIAALYGAARAGAPLEGHLPELPIQYADFVAWQSDLLAGPAFEEQLGYWRRALEGAPEALELAADRPRPARQASRGGQASLDLGPALTRSIKALSQREGVTPFMTLLAAFQVLLARRGGQDDIVVGTPIANRTRLETEGLIGLFANTLALRTRLGGDPTFRDLLGRVREACLGAYAHQDLPFEKLVEALQPTRDLSRSPLFQVLFALQSAPAPALELAGLIFEPIETSGGTAKLDLSLSLAERGGGLFATLEYSADLFGAATAERMLGHYRALLQSATADPGQRVGALPLLAPDEREALVSAWNDTAAPFDERCVHELFEAQVERAPERTALIFEDERLTYGELDRRAEALARRLRARGVGPEVRVGVCVERSIELVVALLGVLKAGGAYVPLDPTYPRERLGFILADARVAVLLTQAWLVEALPAPAAPVLCVDAPEGEAAPAEGPTATAVGAARPASAPRPPTPDDAAYVLYTSGSTGRPKGSVNTHRNVVSFFAGMDQRVGCGDRDVLLAVTSVSFDISVLELFWTLARGATVVLLSEAAAGARAASSSASSSSRGAQPDEADRDLEFSLFYFASDDGASAGAASTEDKYRLLLEGARFADEHGFTAVWTPERHFHPFGGLYPNPSVTGAAIAAITRRVQIRAGSVVMPLHDPIRVAEEWSVVDNLSRGRVGVAFASGWHADDFAFFPERYASRREETARGIDAVRRLWRGEAIAARGGAGNDLSVRIFPRPVQADLPIWITSGGNPETFAQAGALGANVLTHLLGQRVEDLAAKIRVYREARAAHGHDPRAGRVTLMVHAFLGEDRAEVRERIRAPFTRYLRSSVGLVETLIQSLGLPVDRQAMTERDLDEALAHGFDRYFETSALFGTPESCAGLVERLRAIGVDEVACLIDFGVDTDAALGGLRHLHALMERSRRPRRPRARSARSLPEQARAHGATMLQCTPSLMQLLLQDPEAARSLEPLRVVMLGGEALPPALAAEVKRALPARLINMYGPTETTVWSMTHEVREAEGAMPIGRPIANTQVYLLDRRLELVPAGVPGEIYIGGAGVARGYHDRPALTAERFVPDPFGRTPGARLYRTGDVARRRPDGALVFLGRSDQQVKLRGHRIELGEIEAALGRHPAVLESAVVVREDEPGDRRLVGYVVLRGAPAPGAAGPAADPPADLGAFLRERLPETMVPATLVALPALPLTPNGKVDRRALPAPELGRAPEAASREPRTPVEELIAGLWAEALRRERVGVDDDFFQLGGHSLLAMQVVTRVRAAFHVELPLRVLFERPTVAALSAWIERAQRDGAGRAQVPPLAPAPRAEVMPVSFGQQRLWFFDQLTRGSAYYNDVIALRLTGPLDIPTLQRSLDEIARRHEILRTSIVTASDGRPSQRVAPALAAPLSFVDVRADGPDPEAAARQRGAALALTPFDLAAAPLWRICVMRVADDAHVFVLVVHHVIWDGWSLRVFFRELAALYDAFGAGRPSPLPPLPVQYADFASWQRAWLEGPPIEAQLAYWREQLGDEPPALPLPTDRPRPPIETFRGAELVFDVDPALTQAVLRLSRREGVTLFMTLLAAWQVLLWRHTGQGDVSVGTPIATRSMPGTEGLIGVLLNMLVLRTRVDGSLTVRGLLRRVRDVCLDAYAHQDVPFEALVDALKPERRLDQQPLFQVAFVLQNEPLALALPGLEVQPLVVERETARFDLALEAREVGGRLACRIEYMTDLFDAATIARIADGWQALLAQMAADPAGRVAALSALTAPERRRIEAWNATAAPYPEDARLHELFEAQAARSPEAIAIRADGEQVSYAELSRRADRIARYLQRRGIGPDALVAVYLERSIDLVAALLGVLKAGGAYVPLDPAYPTDRVAFMLDDSRAAVILTQASLAAGLPPTSARVACLDRDAADIAASPPAPPARPASSAALAYVIYTSGSTGRPKGVAIAHRSAVAMVAWAEAAFRREELAGVLATTSICFDLSVFELFVPLCTGGRVILAADALAISSLPDGADATLLNTVPSVLGALLRTGTLPPSVRTVNLAGEALPLALVRQLHALPTVERVVNLYGPSEDTTYSTYAEIPRDDDREPAIGRPVSNTQAWVLDPWLEPVPVGAPGELYLAGDGLARGYLRRPGLTAERFVPDPFSREPGRRMYRTGDVVRYRSDGSLAFLGRADHQVKVRGARIELGEIEATLRQHPSVAEAAVAMRQSAAGQPQLVAYVVPGAGRVLERIRRERELCVSPAWFDALRAELPRVREVRVCLKHSPHDNEMTRYRYDVVLFCDEAPADDEAGAAVPGERLDRAACEALLASTRRRALVTGIPNAHLDPAGTLTPADVAAAAARHGCAVQTRPSADPTRFDALIARDAAGVALGLPPVPAPAGAPLINVPAPVAARGDGAAGGREPQAGGDEGAGRDAHVERWAHVFDAAYGDDDLPGDAPLDFRGWKSSATGDELPVEHMVAWLDETAERLASLRPERVVEIGCGTGLLVQRLSPLCRDYLATDISARAVDRVARLAARRGLSHVSVVRQPAHALAGVAERRPDLIVLNSVVQYFPGEAYLRDVLRAAVEAAAPGGRVFVGDVRSFDALPVFHAAVARAGAGGAPVPPDLAEDLRGFLAERLPTYMLPAAFVQLEALPLGPGGKLDRRALPSPSLDPAQAEARVAPRNQIEAALAEIWAEVLGVDAVGVNDNFFGRGGDSLLGIQVVARATERGLSVSPRQLFEHQTVARLAAAITRGATSASASSAEEDPAGPVPLTPIQRWFFEQAFHGQDQWNQARLLETDEALEPALVERALAHVVRQHDALRMRFVADGGGVRQEEEDPDGAVAFTHRDLADLPDAERGPAVERAATDLQSRLNISTGPLVRAALFTFGGAAPSRLLLLAHHLVIDTASWWIVLEDLQTAYAQLRAGEPVRLPPRTSSFRRWAHRLAAYAQSDELARELERWSAPIDGPPARVPVDSPEGSNTEGDARSVLVALDAEETRRLREVQRTRGAQLAEVLVTALAQVLADWTGNPGWWLDLEGHGREDLFADVSLLRTVGWFTTTYPVFVSVEGARALPEALQQVRGQLRRVPGRGFGHGALRYLCAREGVRERLAARPRPEVMFNYLGQFDPIVSRSSLFRLADGSYGDARHPQARRSYRLEINAFVMGGRLQISWRYSPALHRTETVTALAGAFLAALRSLTG
ncbi:amino acid adenylation domain-containing protein [Sorangium sp. So ce1389]|uniref:amino acid adenylation domain-containing protein n=1 Tax=Sorangium sp. So ce1389 TaxID=3133336 RepID=UPI003F6264D3